MAAETTTLPLHSGNRVLRGLVTIGLLTFGMVTHVFVLPTYRVVLDRSGSGVPGWLAASVTAMPWLVLAVLVIAAAVAYRSRSVPPDGRAARMLAMVDTVLLLWVWAIGLFFLYVAIAIPQVMR